MLFIDVETLIELLINSLIELLLLLNENEFKVIFPDDVFKKEEPILLLLEPSTAKVLLFPNEKFVLLFIFTTKLLDEKEAFEPLSKGIYTEISFEVLGWLELLSKDSPFVILLLLDKAGDFTFIGVFWPIKMEIIDSEGWFKDKLLEEDKFPEIGILLFELFNIGFKAKFTFVKLKALLKWFSLFEFK